MSPGRPVTRAQAVVLALVALHALVRIPPWSPYLLGVGLDASWDWIFHETWSRGLACGREVVFTYGPWGFLLTGSYHPATYATMVAVYAGVALVLATGLWSVLRRSTASSFALLAWLVAAVEAISLWDPGQTLFYHLAFVLVLARFRVTDPTAAERVLLHLLAAALALASLVKFTILVCAGIAVGAVALDIALRERAMPWILATFAAAFAAAWLAAGQEAAGLALYFQSSIEIARGYNENMAFAGPAAHVVLYVPAALLILGLLSRTRSPGGWLELAGLSGLAFVVFKISFVRHDAHALISAVTLGFWLLVALPLARPWAAPSAEGQRPRILATAALLATVLFADVVTQAFAGRHVPTRILERLERWPKDAAAALSVLSGRAPLARDHARMIATVRREAPLPPIQGSVDVVPVNQGLALAHGLDYRPRPVIQSYSAYTPALARRNADHFSGPDAPENVLFAILTTDERFPALDDSLAWPVLMTRYDVQELQSPSSKHLWLRRSAKPRSWRTIRESRARGELGHATPLPETDPGGLVWGRIDLRLTAAGRIAELLYRAPLLWISVRLRNGHSSSFRLAPGVARAGFALSPLIGNADDFRKFLSASGATALRDYDVVAIAIGGEGGADVTWAWQPGFDLEFESLELERQAGL